MWCSHINAYLVWPVPHTKQWNCRLLLKHFHETLWCLFVISDSIHPLHFHCMNVNIYLNLCPLNDMRGVNDDRIYFFKIRSHWYKIKQARRGDDFDGAVIRTLNDEENVKMLWCCNHSPACQQCCDMRPQLFPWVMWPPLFLSGLMQLSVKISQIINPFLKRQNTSFWTEKHMVRHFRISLIVIWIWIDLQLSCRIKTTVAFLFSHTETDY